MNSALNIVFIIYAKKGAVTFQNKAFIKPAIGTCLGLFLSYYQAFSISNEGLVSCSMKHRVPLVVLVLTVTRLTDH